MGWYEEWFGTHYYALLYGHRDAEEASSWVKAILKRWHLPIGSRILDLACGRGRHAHFFALAGMQVTGLDISEESIVEARIQAPNATFVVHDMREPFATNAFVGVVCLFTSLGYYETRMDDQRVFQAASTALAPGGYFVVDFMNSEKVVRDLVETEHFEREGVVFNISRAIEQDVIVKRIEVLDGDRSLHFEERVLALSSNDLEEMALNAGLEIVDRTGGPHGEPFERYGSDRFVLWMRKPRV